jgi:hypothetical protein
MTATTVAALANPSDVEAVEADEPTPERRP